MATSTGTVRQRGLIQNPLRERYPRKLDDDVRQFHTRVGLGSSVDVDILVRGARAARDPHLVDAIPGISEVEKAALKNERHWGFREQTEELKVAILVTAFSAIIQGWQQSTINAAAPDWGCAFEFAISSCPKDSPQRAGRGSLLFGFINAAPALVGSVVGAWISDPVQERVTGRLPALFIAAIFSLVAAIGSFYVQTWQQLLGFRIIMGVGMGAKASIAPVLAAEVAVDHLRGSLIMCWQLFDALGIFLGFAVSVAVYGQWRLILASAMVPVVPLFVLIYLCPESPRFLIRKNRYAKAYHSLRRFRRTEIQACRDLYFIHSQLQMETTTFRRDAEETRNWYEHEFYQDEVRDMHYLQRVYRLVTRKRNLRASVSACLCMLAQQLCGINILAFYSSSVYGTASANEAVSPGRTAAWLSFAFGLANFLFTIPAYRRIDSWGRRSLLLFSLAGMAISLTVVAPCFKIAEQATRTAVVAVLTIVIFTFFYSVGAGPVPFTVSAEVFPLAYREVGMSISVMVNFGGLGLLVLFVPKLTEVFGGHSTECKGAACQDASLNGQAGLLGMFAGFNVVAFILVFFLVPSTADPTLEELNWIFNTKMGAHLRFQFFETIPWLFRLLSPFHHAGEKPNFIMHERELDALPNGNATTGAPISALPIVRPITSGNGHLAPPPRPAPPMHTLRQPAAGLQNHMISNGTVARRPTTTEVGSETLPHDGTSDSNIASTADAPAGPHPVQPRREPRHHPDRPESDGLLGDTVNQLMSMRALMDEALEGLTTWQLHARYQRLPHTEPLDEGGMRDAP